MSDTPDLDALAKRYLDLWQEELSRLASDKEVAETMARTIELMNAGAARFADAMRGTAEKAGGDDGGAGTRGGGAAKPADAGGAAAVGAARRGADSGLERLQARVAELERRLAALEGGSKKPRATEPRSKPKPKRRRRAPRPAGKRRS